MKVPLVYFEEGVSTQIGRILKENHRKKAIIVFDGGIRKAGLADPVLRSLDASGIEYVVFSEVVPDPVSTDINQGAAVARAASVDAVIGLGGGSSMDTAKAIYIMLGKPETDDILDLVHSGTGLEELDKLPNITLVMIPTTSGTGSEVTDGAIITNEAAGLKCPIRSKNVIPDIALLDPLLEINLPLSIAAPCAMDALSHSMESYLVGGIGGLGPMFNAWAEMMSIEGTRQIFTYLPKLLKDPSNVEYRAHIKFACLVSGLAAASGGIALGHGMAHAMGTVWHMPHGAGCALGLVPSIIHGAKLEYNSRERVARLAEAAGVTVKESMSGDDIVQALVKATETLIDTAGIPTLKELGKHRDEWLDQISEKAMQEAVCQFSASLDEIRGYFEYLFAR